MRSVSRIVVYVRTRSVLAAGLFANLIGIGVAEGQGQDTVKAVRAQGGNVPEEAKSLIVDVRSYFTVSGAPELGAGIIFGTKGSALYIATASHVVQRDTVAARRILVRFHSGDSTEATLAHPKEGELDLAVLSVVGDPARLHQWAPSSWDRRGDVGALRSDDPVSPVGCPRNRCWEAPVPADRVVGIDRLGILFQSSFIGPGSSGGALFNSWWEVVGLVTKHEPARANALSIDDVLRQVEAWEFPVTLKRPSVPRAGYRTTLGAVVMTSTSSATGATDGGRVPSGRVTLVRQVSPVVSWHVAGLRLAPENLAVTAGMAGVGLHLKKGRFALHPFVEAGFGHVEGRFDLGGYWIATPGGTRYVPFWNRVVDDRLGMGGGMTVEVVTWSRAIVELTAGYWRFTTPENTPKLNNLFIGAGLGWGL